MHHMCTSHHLVKKNSYLLGSILINEDKHAILLTRVSKIACLSSFMRMLPKRYEFFLTRWCDVHIWCISKTNFLCLIVCCLNVLPLHTCYLYIHIVFMNHSSRKKLGCHLHTTTWYKWFLLFQRWKECLSSLPSLLLCLGCYVLIKWYHSNIC